MTNAQQDQQTPSQYCSAVLERRYRSALALNNIGVRLLEHNCFPQAVETLQNASNLMQSLLMEILGCHEFTAIQANDSGEALIAGAMKHLSEPAMVKKKALYFQVLTATQDGALVSEGELPDSTTPTCLQLMLQTISSALSAFPIRMEENLLMVDPTFLDQAECSPAIRIAVLQQTSILAHNFSIANYCSSKTTTVATDSQELLQSAVRLSGGSVSAIVKEYISVLRQRENNEADHTELDHELDARLENLPCLLIALIHSMINALEESAQYEKASRLHALLQSIAFDANKVNATCFVPNAAAAA